jgi:hypothetical protein
MNKHIMVDFPTWFHAGWYGGLTCCTFAITTNAFYSTLRGRGRSRQLARVIVTCTISALLLFPAMIWFNSRFISQQGALSVFEISGMLVYIALCGWVVPLSVTGFYCFLVLPRSSTAIIPKFTRTPSSTTTYQPPRYQPGVEIPFVFGEDIPWGWLEYSSGSFHGQRLALKRAIVTIGRDENCDIWIDDEMASRHHAELAWDSGHVYLTDCDSLNGVLLNKRPVRGTALLASNDILQVGTHCFVFVLAQRQDFPVPQDDPLNRHTWRYAQDFQTGVSQPVSQVEPTNTTSSPPSSTVVSPPLRRTAGGPTLLKLPSKQKN